MHLRNESAIGLIEFLSASVRSVDKALNGNGDKRKWKVGEDGERRTKGTKVNKARGIVERGKQRTGRNECGEGSCVNEGSGVVIRVDGGPEARKNERVEKKNTGTDTEGHVYVLR